MKYLHIPAGAQHIFPLSISVGAPNLFEFEDP